jgi:hypothetical protein
MFNILETHWPKLALLLTLALLAGLFFVPALAQGFAMSLIALMLGMGLLLLALRHWRAYRAGKLSWRELARNIFIETAILVLVFALARFAGGLVAGFVQDGYGWLLGLLSAIVVRRGRPFDFATQQVCPQDAGAVGQGVGFIASFAAHNQKPPTLNEWAAGS